MNTPFVGMWGAVIAQWIRLHLQSGSLGFESQAHHLGFSIYSQIIYCICHFVAKRTKINNRDPIWPILKNKATHLFVPIGKAKNFTIDHISFIFRYVISNLWHYDSDRDKITKVLITVLPPALICLFSFFSTTIL